MTAFQIALLALFGVGYLGITLEHKFHINKAACALTTAALLWVLAVTVGGFDASTRLTIAGSEIFEIIVFLLGAMALVEILAHYRFFDVIKMRITQLGVSEKTLFVLLSVLTFFLSAIINNLTVVIVMIQVARKFFWEENLLVMAASIVIAANAGGTFSPIGDITTIMLWLADKFTTGKILVEGFLPSLVLLGVSTGLLVRNIKSSDSMTRDPATCTPLTRGEKIIITIACLSFMLPIAANAIGLTPVIGILLGVGITWIAIDLLKSVSKTKTHLTATIERLLQKADMGSIQFFIGILLAVSALELTGILDIFSHALFPEGVTASGVIIGSTLLGLLSSLFDNIPLTAIAIDIIPTTNQSLWVLLALAVGTGGSLLSIGSASGVVAMGLLPKLSFITYFKIAFIPALAGYVACIGTWLLFFIF